MTNAFSGTKMVAVSFITLMGAFGLNLTAGQFFAPLNDAYGWDLAILSLAVSLNMIIWGVFQPIMGKLIDKFGPKSVITGSAALMGIAFILSATITQLWQFFLYYGVFTAIGFAGCGSMANSVLISRWYVKKRAKMLSRSSMGMNIGQLILLPLTGFLIASTSFQTAFVVLGFIMLVIVVPIICIVVKNNPSDDNQLPDGDSTSLYTEARSVSLMEALKSSDFWIATLGFATCGFTLYLVTMHIPSFAVDLGGGESLGGKLLGIAALASACSMWMTGQFTRKIGKKNLLVFLYVVRLLAFLWLALSPGIWQLYVFAVVYGVSSMPIIPLVTGIIGDRFGKNAMGSILGFSWFIHQVFAALGVFLGGYLRTMTGNYETAFWSGAVLLVFGVILTTLIKEQPVPVSSKVTV
ncbi:MFS transporter [Gracilibacillus suaedae]|uniref:MFS transporter n=1 Tax=Gracilibacillus suaedae TaxID=2820273 RepID=UPI001ABE0C74|nr:MFS transporter [Gracilibacillus suaedae]